jgi:hypothetical protein
MSIKGKPFWVRPFVQNYQWVTIHPHIYAPREYFLDTSNPKWTPILNHEAIHLMRQRMMGPLKWLARYAVDKRFRLDEECRAIVVEMLSSPEAERPEIHRRYALMLSGPEYRYTAESTSQAWLRINYFLNLDRQTAQ